MEVPGKKVRKGRWKEAVAATLCPPGASRPLLAPTLPPLRSPLCQRVE